MCGIAGLIDPHRSADLGAIAVAMAERLLRRGPDAGGAWSDPAVGIALAHRRLAIVDLSVDGAQPMTLGDLTVTFNGEIYNWRELRSELEALGHRFRSRSDTEVLLVACRQWGVVETLPRLRGMFAVALWDGARRELWLARDRMGEKPLCWGRIGDAIVFASETSALRAHPQWRGDIDREALAAYVSLGWIPAPRTIYRGIAKLPPGTWLCIRLGDGTPRVEGPTAWWSTAAIAAQGRERPFTGNAQAASEQLETLLRSAVSEQMLADVPLGAFLSGGIDSSAVVALMQAQTTQPVRTFTIGFREPGFDEAAHAQRVAAHLRTAHTELYLDGDQARTEIPRLAGIADEPFADASVLPTYLVARLARQSVTVALSGDGGDELFAGYNRHRWGARLWPSLTPIPLGLRRIAGGLMQAAPDELIHAAARLTGRGGAEPTQSLRRFARAFGASDPDDMHARILARITDPARLLADHGAAPALGAAVDAGEPDAVRRMQLADQLTWLPDDCLVKVDRAAMAVSLESRVPLLDHRIVSFAWSLPTALTMRDGVGKQPLRQLLARQIPPALFERPKSGFTVPLGAWLAGPLRAWGDDLLSTDRLRRDGLLDPVGVAQLWSEVRAGRGDPHAAWTLLSLQAWREAQR